MEDANTTEDTRAEDALQIAEDSLKLYRKVEEAKRAAEQKLVELEKVSSFPGEMAQGVVGFFNNMGIIPDDQMEKWAGIIADSPDNAVKTIGHLFKTFSAAPYREGSGYPKEAAKEADPLSEENELWAKVATEGA